MKKTLAILAAFTLLPIASCGGASGEEAPSADEWPLEIVAAEWSADGGEARAVVAGKWVRGLSTPPTCHLIEGPDGARSAWAAASSNTSPDGNSFSKEFSAAGGRAELDPLPDYHVRCSVNLSTGRTLDAVAPVSGEAPRG